MALMNSTQFRSVVSPILNTIFDGIYDSVPTEWDKVFEVETALERRFEEEVMLEGLGAAQIKQEGGRVDYDEGGEAYTVRYEPKTFALAFAMTREAMDDGDHIGIGRIYSKHLAKSMLEAKEVFHAAVLNFAFDAGHVGGDGVSLLSANHPTRGGGFSNILTTPANLSVAALEQMRVQIRTVRDERGKVIGLKPRTLIVPPDLVATAWKILNSTSVPSASGTSLSGGGNYTAAPADKNFIQAQGIIPGGIVEMSRLSNPKAWFISTDAPQGLTHKRRKPVEKSMEGDFETDTMRYKATERYDAKWTNPRCLFGSQGV